VASARRRPSAPSVSRRWQQPSPDAAGHRSTSSSHAPALLNRRARLTPARSSDAPLASDDRRPTPRGWSFPDRPPTADRRAPHP
jgi:hypothetical protein